MQRTGFTLSELLIALAVLGLIATFTIPKVLQSQQSSEFNAKGKEAASMISGAFDAYKSQNTLTSGMRLGDLTPYINYVSVNTTGLVIDELYGSGAITVTCDASRPCLKLHNGATLMYFSNTFGGTADTSALYFNIDPDSVTQGTTNGPGKAVQLFLYYNGRITSKAFLDAGAANSSGNLGGPRPDREPPWFSWN